MPTYEYECDACGHAFERLQSMSEPAVRKCPKCRKLRVRRLISGGAGVIFKGSGFYETDYKRNRAGPGSTARPKDEGGSSPPAKDAGGGAAATKGGGSAAKDADSGTKPGRKDRAGKD